jgi:hypothetical protein
LQCRKEVLDVSTEAGGRSLGGRRSRSRERCRGRRRHRQLDIEQVAAGKRLADVVLCGDDEEIVERELPEHGTELRFEHDPQLQLELRSPELEPVTPRLRAPIPAS